MWRAEGGISPGPFCFWKSPQESTYDLEPSRAAMPPLPCAAGTFQKIPGLRGPHDCNCTADPGGTGIPCFFDLWMHMAMPTAMAESPGLAGPPDVGVGPVEAPGPAICPGRFQHAHRALEGAQG